jgi:hypothetical protein
MKESKLPDPQQVAASWRERLAKIRAQAEVNTEIALQAGTESAERYLKTKWSTGGKGERGT